MVFVDCLKLWVKLAWIVFFSGLPFELTGEEDSRLVYNHLALASFSFSGACQLACWFSRQNSIQIKLNPRSIKDYDKTYKIIFKMNMMRETIQILLKTMAMITCKLIYIVLMTGEKKKKIVMPHKRKSFIFCTNSYPEH